MELTTRDMKKRILFFSEDQMYGSQIDRNLESSDFVYLGWYKRWNKLVTALKVIQPDFLLIEFTEKGDLSIIREIKKINRLINLVVISPKNDRASILQALKSGAHGYLIKSSDIQETIQDVCKLALGGVALSAPAAKSIVMGFWKTNNSPLTVTETKVLKFVSLGHTYSSLAKNLDIKKGTAKTHLKNIYRKLNIHRKSEALEVAYVERLIN
jgi:DNA-binding NarL/FixJ family response regulator